LEMRGFAARQRKVKSDNVLALGIDATPNVESAAVHQYLGWAKLACQAVFVISFHHLWRVGQSPSFSAALKAPFAKPGIRRRRRPPWTNW
jgi:hypothetical protein